MADGRPGESEALHRASRWLHARGAATARRWPALIFVTDPARVADPVAVAARLPRGSAVIYRAFGAADAVRIGLALRRVTRRRGVLLLAGADPALARSIGADGVHLPERTAHRAAEIRRRNPRWIVTAAAHGRRALLAAERGGAQAVLLSPVFPSASASAGRPLGSVRFAGLARSSGLPVYALGGISAGTAARLRGSGAIGFAAVEALGTFG